MDNNVIKQLLEHIVAYLTVTFTDLEHVIIVQDMNNEKQQSFFTGCVARMWIVDLRFKTLKTRVNGTLQ